HCEMCHGPNRNRVTSPSILGPERFKDVVRLGNGGQMPGFSESTITSAQLEALMAYTLNPAAAGPMTSADGSASPDAASGETRYYTPYNTWNASNGLPAIGPPWSEIVAYDLGTGSIKWRIPFG